MKKSTALSVLVFLFLVFPLLANTLPDDGYDYEGAMALFSKDFAAETQKTVEEWNATASYWLVYQAGPFIKDDALMGAYVIMLRRVLNDKSDQPGRVIEQSVSTWFSPENPGTFMSLGQLRQKYPQFEGKRGPSQKGADIAEEFVDRMHSLKIGILEKRADSLARLKLMTSQVPEMERIYGAERDRTQKMYNEFKVPGSEGGKTRYDPYTGEWNVSDVNPVTPGGGVHVSQDELLIWEMENGARAEIDFRRRLEGYYSDYQKKQNEISAMVQNYLALKKALKAVERARTGTQKEGDHQLVTEGMKVLDSYKN